MTREQVESRIALVKMQNEQRKDNVKETLRMLSNDFGTTSQSDGEVVNLLAPNFMMSTRRTLLAQLYPADPIFHCRPRIRGFEGRAKAIETILSYYWSELKIKKAMRQIIDDVLIYGYGVAKVGMGSLETGIISEETEEEAATSATIENGEIIALQSVSVEESDNHNLHLQLHVQLLEDPALLAMEASADLFEILNKHIEEHQEYLEDPLPSFPTSAGKGPNYDWPFVESVGPDVFWDPMVIDPQDSPYIVHRIKKRLKDVKDDPLYSHTETLSPDSYNSEEFNAYNNAINEGRYSSYVPEELGTITLYEIWDADEKSVSTWVESEDVPIRPADKDAWPQFIQGYPFHWLNFTDLPDEVHGPGIMEYLKWPQKFLMRIYSELATHSDRSGVKFEVDENRLSQRETQDSIEAKLADPTSHVALFVQEPGAISPIQPAMVDPTKMQLIGLLQRVIDENSGLSAQMRGVSASDTATQASIMASASNVLITDSIDRIQTFQEGIASTLIGELRQFGPEEQLFYVTTPNGDQWENYSINDVQADWQVSVEMPAPFQNERDKQEWLNMFHMFQPIMDPAGKQQFMLDGMRLFGIKNPSIYVEQPSVEVQMHIQSENRLMTLGQQVQAVPDERHQAHIEGHSRALQDWNTTIQNNIGQLVENSGMSPEDPEGPKMVEQQLMQNPQTQSIIQAMNLAKAHIAEHQQLMQQEGTEGGGGRRRQAVPLPTGNAGRTESIVSNQMQGT
tara:strand:- start:2164 stop:4374 length:2211 start_codon:yes stop_codon:yes gene_type:complete